MQVEIVRGLRALERLEPDWWRLFRSARAPTPFQSPAWLLPWCRHLGRGEPLAIAIRDGGELVALAPFSIDEEDGARVLRPLGEGVTDICDALLASARDRDLAETLLGALAGLSGWERCEWSGIPHDSHLIAAAKPWRPSCSEEVAPVLPLAHGAREVTQAVPRGMAENIEACRKRAEKFGPLSFQAASGPDCGSFLDVLFALHAARWASSGEAGVLAHPAVQAFHREALPELIGAGLARIHLVRIGERVAAAHYGLAAGRAHFYYIGGYDPGLRAAGPGNLAVAHAIGRALAEEAQAFQFLRGDEPYKRRWGAQPIALVTLSFTPLAMRPGNPRAAAPVPANACRRADPT
jgi:CelD/BcsL family acetyltransferase involved in cellulose biosynthesis